MRPKVLLFDEPLSNLDLKLREQLRLEIKHLQRELGITSIFVTHDQTEALVMSDRIAVMRDGQIEQLDTPEGIYHEPASAFVAGFVGQSNLIPGVCTGWRRRVHGPAVHRTHRAGPRRGQVTAGAAVQVLLRPEALRLGPTPAGPAIEGRWSRSSTRAASRPWCWTSRAAPCASPCPTPAPCPSPGGEPHCRHPTGRRSRAAG